MLADRSIDNAVWTDEGPFPAMAEVMDRPAFYPERAQIVVG